MFFNDDVDTPGWKEDVKALREGGITMSLNKLDIWGSNEDISVPREDNPIVTPLSILKKKLWAVLFCYCLLAFFIVFHIVLEENKLPTLG